jgi:ComF family protein
MQTMNISQRLTTWLRLVLDLIAPRICPECGRRLDSSGKELCPYCLKRYPRTNYHLSPTDNDLARLFWGQFPIERAVAFYYYSPQSKLARVVHAFKYHGRIQLAQELGELMAKELLPNGIFEGVDALIPLPLAPAREQERGYNQAYLLAEGISKTTGIPIYNNVLKRGEFMQSQTLLGIWQRRQNVDDAFKLVDGSMLEGLHVMLIDDVITTGATITACAKQLALVPNIIISVLTLAHTVK